MPTLDHENLLRTAGYRIVAGIDEAGRGPLAGPVCVAAVVLPDDFTHAVLNDSKQLSEVKRERLYEEITADPRIRWHCVSVEPDEIDRINILKATFLAMKRALDQLQGGSRRTVDCALVDGNQRPPLSCEVACIVRGDGRSLSIAAASVVAKVTRDRLMGQLALDYPGYGWQHNAGYGTAEHQAAIRRLGPTPHHRRSFAPIADLFEKAGNPAAS